MNPKGTAKYPIEGYDGPDYARSKNGPGRRCRTIIQDGNTNAESCTNCSVREIECYRHWSFTRCAFCTARDYNSARCHLKGEPDFPARRHKKRKIEDDSSRPDTPGSYSGNADEEAQISAEKSLSIAPDLAQLQINPTQGIPLDERVASLEERITKMHKTLIKIVAELHELNQSAEDARPGPQPKAEAMQIVQSPAIEPKTTAVKDWEDGEKQPEHTISHSVSFRPINCICATPYTLRDNSVMPREARYRKEG